MVYKLYQINQNINDGNESEKKKMLAVIRKCTILTIFSMLTTFTVFIVGMTQIINGEATFELNVLWGYVIILDVNSNFICVILSNSFCDNSYLNLCGCIDNCVRKCCINDGGEASRERLGSMSPQSNPEKELSSYMGTTKQKKETMNELDLNEEGP